MIIPETYLIFDLMFYLIFTEPPPRPGLLALERRALLRVGVVHAEHLRLPLRLGKSRSALRKCPSLGYVFRHPETHGDH